MNPTRVKFLVAGLILAGAVGYLGYAGVMAGRASYLTVDDFLADAKLGADAKYQYRDAERQATRPVRLRGKAIEEGLVIDIETSTATFTMVGEKAEGGGLPVVYKGVLPDLFKAGVEILVTGRMGKDGVFEADVVATKCPSKYGKGPAESETP